MLVEGCSKLEIPSGATTEGCAGRALDQQLLCENWA
jgi:hypothetical protein